MLNTLTTWRRTESDGESPGQALPRKRHARSWVAYAALACASPMLASSAPNRTLNITGAAFRCITEMTRVRHFYVDNLAGNLQGTLAVANSASGGAYPVGSVLQLVPTEAMVKREKGFSPATNDWEFFALDVDKDGTRILSRGFVEVNNRFGGNCFACHIKARPQWDLVCDNSHGCDPIPITRAMSGALQRTDPRCKSQEPVSAADAEALKQLGEVVKGIQAANAAKH